MKKKIVVVLSLVLCLMLSISLAACNKNKHEAKSEWKFDNAQHWHECATKGHDDKLDVAAHTWNDGVFTTEPTETADGVKTYTCTVCGATKTESVPKLNHTHTFDMTNWEMSDTHHWHKATCAHTDEKNGYEEHKGDWTEKTPAGYGVDKVEERTCTVCRKHQERTVENSALAAKDNTVTVGTIDFTYNAKSQPIDSLVTAGNKAGMVVKYVGVDGTTYEESTTAPTNAGTYQYTITIPATAEWKAAEKSGKFTIEKYELTMLYEKQTIEYDGKAEKDGTKRIWFRFNTLENNTPVNIAVIMDSANVGAKVSEVWLPELLRTDNYTVDKDKVQIEIVAKKLSGLSFSVNEADIDKEQDVCKIEREITGANNEKLIVTIEFRWVDLNNEEELELKTTLPAVGAGGCKISLKVANANYEFYGNIGTLTLVRETA